MPSAKPNALKILPFIALLLLVSIHIPVVGVFSGKSLSKSIRVESSLQAVLVRFVIPLGTTVIVTVAVSQLSEPSLSQI